MPKRTKRPISDKFSFHKIRKANFFPKQQTTKHVQLSVVPPVAQSCGRSLSETLKRDIIVKQLVPLATGQIPNALWRNCIYQWFLCYFIVLHFKYSIPIPYILSLPVPHTQCINDCYKKRNLGSSYFSVVWDFFIAFNGLWKECTDSKYSYVTFIN